APATRSVLAPRMPDPRDDPRLVVRHPVRDAVAQTLCDNLRILDEGLGRRAGGPAALVLEPLRRVPVKERRKRGDSGGEQVVDEPVVEVETRLIHLPATVRHDPRPRDREAERVEPELAHELDVAGIAVVEVAGNGARIAVSNLARRRAEAIPHAL